MKIVKLNGFELFQIVVGENRSSYLNKDSKGREFVDVCYMEMGLNTEQIVNALSIITSNVPQRAAEIIGVEYQII